ncbi:MAG: class I SAM-dependent methyltransferase [Bacteroidales bacterium]|nr:MAG: class I SAM-dependent methyltransferase [Bacteroidales bacterium]
MSHSFEYPDFVARFYDIIYKKVRSGVDTEYFMNKILGTSGKVLEIGVGTGRFFINALEKGADIYGIDISKSMIDILKTKLNPENHYRVITGDAASTKLDIKFDLILAPFHVFAHVLETTEQITCLNNVYEHLDEKGRFIFDVFVPNPKLMAEGINEVTDFEGEYEPGRKVRRIVSSKTDIVNQLLDVTMKFVWDENNKQAEKEWSLQMRLFFRYELEYLVKRSKLTLVNIFGDYQENLLNSDSKEFIVVCKK